MNLVRFHRIMVELGMSNSNAYIADVTGRYSVTLHRHGYLIPGNRTQILDLIGGVDK